MPLHRLWIYTISAGLLLTFALIGVSQLRTDISPDALLASGHESYQRYLEYISQFPLEQLQVQLIVRGPVLSVDSLGTMLEWERILVADAAVTEVYSFLSDARARQLLESPDELQSYLSANAALRSAFLSDNFQTTLMAVVLSEDVRYNPERLNLALLRVRAIVQSSGNNLDVAFTGLPVLSNSLAKSLTTDFWSNTVLGVLAATLIALLFFRSLWAVLVSLAAPLLGILLLYGVMGWVGVKVTLATQIVGLLVFVVAYTDSLFLCRHFLESNFSAHKVTRLIQDTYRVVGPPCLITSITTALGFASLSTSSANSIKALGLLGVFGMLLTFIMVMLFLPLTLNTLRSINFSSSMSFRFPKMLYQENLDRRKETVKLYIFFGFLVFSVLVSVGLRSDYTVGENLSLDSEYRQSMLLADQELGGLVPIQIMIQWSGPKKFNLDRSMLATLSQLQNKLEESTGFTWLSINDVLRALPESRFDDKLTAIPRLLRDRFVNFETSTVLMSTRLHYAEKEAMDVALKRLGTAVAGLEKSHPGIQFDVVGVVPLAMAAGKRILSDLLYSLAAALCTIFLTLAVCFRSVLKSVVCLLPSVGAVATIALLLVLLGEPVRYVTMIVFSLCLSLVVDHSIHIGFRVDRLQKLGNSRNRCISQALDEIGSTALVAQTVVLAGIAALIISQSPTISDVGLLAVVALLTGLILNLLFLPLLLRWNKVSGIQSALAKARKSP